MHWMRSSSIPDKDTNTEGSVFIVESSSINGNSPMYKAKKHNDIEIDNGAHDSANNYRPYLQLELSAVRFICAVLLGLGVVVMLYAVFLHGVTLKKDIVDPIGSSKKADDEVAYYQSISGYLVAFTGELMETSFHVFLVVMSMYLTNLRWYPKDNPSTLQQSWFKSIALFFFVPAIMYVLNVAFAGINIQHRITGIAHVFVDEDLIATALAVNSSLSASNAVEYTALRAAVLRKVTPYEIYPESYCLIRPNTSSSDDFMDDSLDLPTVKDIRSTSTVFGFPLQTWNHAAIPNALLSTNDSISFLYSDLKNVQENVTIFEDGIDYSDWYDLFLQGKTMLERSISDSDATINYPCTWSDGRTQDDLPADAVTSDDFVSNTTFLYYPDGPYAGMRACYGAVSSLKDLADRNDPSTHNLQTYVDTVMSGINSTITQLALDESTVIFERYVISPQVNLSVLTLDIPLSSSVQYRNVSIYCNDDGTLLPELVDTIGSLTDDQEATLASLFCNQTFYPYDTPRATCGAKSCVFLDKSGSLPFKKQIQLLPYLTNCSVEDLKYDNDLHNFLPTNCQAQSDAVFLYGLGTHMSGDLLSNGKGDFGFPYIENPRRHLVLSFGKLNWELKDLSSMFSAQCGAPDGCDGLVHQLTNLTAPMSDHTQVLVAGNKTLPQARFGANFTTPVDLVTLNAQPFYYPSDNRYYEWEYLNTQFFTQVDWDKPLEGDQCHVLLDAYIDQVEENHYFLDDPRQVMYTSAIYYLFQQAAVKDVVLPKELPKDAVPGLYFGTSTRFKGDREKKEVKFAIQLASAIPTFGAIGLLFFFSFWLSVGNHERVKFTNSTNPAAKYADVLIEDEYPEQVDERKLIFESGKTVEMDNYMVESITFSRKGDPLSRVHM